MIKKHLLTKLHPSLILSMTSTSIKKRVIVSKYILYRNMHSDIISQVIKY